MCFNAGNAEGPIPMSPTLVKNRKVSYGDVNKVSFHVPSSTSSVPDTASSAQNVTTTSDSISDTSSPPGSHNNSDNNIGVASISESLKYDLQSEDGESAMEKRQAAAAAAVALKAVHDRKNYGIKILVRIGCELSFFLTTWIAVSYLLLYPIVFFYSYPHISISEHGRGRWH